MPRSSSHVPVSDGDAECIECGLPTHLHTEPLTDVDDGYELVPPCFGCWHQRHTGPCRIRFGSGSVACGCEVTAA